MRNVITPTLIKKVVPMKKIILSILFCASVYSSFTICMDRFGTERNYDYSIGAYKTTPDDFTVTNCTTGEKYKLRGYEGNINALIIKSKFIICSTVSEIYNWSQAREDYVISGIKSRIYIWDLQNKFRLCGLCKFLRDTAGIDLNDIIGLSPVIEIECPDIIKRILFDNNHARLLYENGTHSSPEIEETMTLRLNRE